MNEISPNPLLTLQPDNPDVRTRSLPTYLESLRKLDRRGLSTGYGGHRDTIMGLPARIQEILTHHDERAERVLGLVVEDGPHTAYTLMEMVFPNLPVTEVFSGMSEIIGHLDLF